MKLTHDASPGYVFSIDLDAHLAECEEEEEREAAAAEAAEAAKAAAAAAVPDALAKARALALKHKPETSSRLRFVQRLSTSTVGSPVHEETRIQPQEAYDEVRAAVAAIPEADLLVFNFPRAPEPGRADGEVWRSVEAAVGSTTLVVLPLSS